MRDEILLATENLFSFFYERINDAQQIQGADFDEHTEFYLVNLLVDFLRTGRLLESGGRRVDDLPVTIRLLESNFATPEERYRELKHVGDTTLYLLGWFAESLRRSLVDTSYYIGLGEAAYHRLARLPAGFRGDRHDPVFAELARKFSAAVAVLNEVREQGLMSTRDIVQLYEQWLVTGSHRAAERLRELGVLLSGQPPRPGKILQ